MQWQLSVYARRARIAMRLTKLERPVCLEYSHWHGLLGILPTIVGGLQSCNCLSGTLLSMPPRRCPAASLPRSIKADDTHIGRGREQLGPGGGNSGKRPARFATCQDDVPDVWIRLQGWTEPYKTAGKYNRVSKSQSGAGRKAS